MSDSCFYDDDDEFWKEMDEHEREEDTVIDPRRPRKIEPDPHLPERVLPPQILPGLFRGDYGLLTAMGGTGKSFFALTWAVFRLLGLEYYADKDLPPLNKITYMAFEENPDVLQKRIEDIMRFFNKPIKEVFYNSYSPPLIQKDFNEDIFNRLNLLSFKGVPVRLLNSDGTVNSKDVDLLKKNIPDGTDLLIIDPLIKIGGFNENDNCQAGYFAAVLEQIAVEKDLSILLSHHVSKQAGRDGINDQTSARGASAIVDESRATYPMKSSVFKYGKDSYVGVLITAPKLNYMPPQEPKQFFKVHGGIPIPAHPMNYLYYLDFGIPYKEKPDADGIYKRPYKKKEKKS
ncbi:MAG: AAA family ATPase [Eubacteriales bacterium]|nr:AAA family ATPase [Eubacteriales bacterium]